MADLDTYLNLVTSEHQGQPSYTAMLTALLQPLVDCQGTLDEVEVVFDVDTAVGDPLDKVGQWVGISRILPSPITDVYFTLDSDSLGLDFGSLQGPFDPVNGLIILPDDAYRTLLKATIIANAWDGTIPGAYAAWDALFVGTGFNILIENSADVMHVTLALTGPYPDAITLGLFLGGYLVGVPAGVEVDSYEINSLPYFALDLDTLPFGGLDVGAFGVIVG